MTSVSVLALAAAVLVILPSTLSLTLQTELPTEHGAAATNASDYDKDAQMKALDKLLASLEPYDPTGTPEKRATLCPYANQQVYVQPPYGAPGYTTVVGSPSVPAAYPGYGVDPNYVVPHPAPPVYPQYAVQPPPAVYPPYPVQPEAQIAAPPCPAGAGYCPYQQTCPTAVSCPQQQVGVHGPPGPPGAPGVSLRCQGTGLVAPGTPGPPGPPGRGCPGPPGMPGRPGACHYQGGGYDPLEIVRIVVRLIIEGGACTSRIAQCDGDMNTLVTQLTMVQHKVDQIRKLDNRVDLLTSAVAQLRVQIQSQNLLSGPHGPSGQKGTPGDVGDRGPMGQPGECPQAVCNSGPPGPPGRAGSLGDIGPKGECCYGVRGERGPKGPTGGGLKGPQGAPGSKGDQGDRGIWIISHDAGRPQYYRGSG